MTDIIPQAAPSALGPIIGKIQSSKSKLTIADARHTSGVVSRVLDRSAKVIEGIVIISNSEAVFMIEVVSIVFCTLAIIIVINMITMKRNLDANPQDPAEITAFIAV